jgi:hypothetical protein
MRNTARSADFGNHLCFATPFGAECMIDCCSLDFLAASCGGKEEKREAVGTA